MLYGRGTVFDFGVYVEAVAAFFGDRSQCARRSVTAVRVAREVVEVRKGDAVVGDGAGVDAYEGLDMGVGGDVDVRWVEACEFVKRELLGLRHLEVIIWSGCGGSEGFPSLVAEGRDE